MTVLKLIIQPKSKLALPTPNRNISRLTHHEIVILPRGLEPLQPAPVQFPQEALPRPKVTDVGEEGLGYKGSEELTLRTLDHGKDGAIEGAAPVEHGGEGEAMEIGAVQQ